MINLENFNADDILMFDRENLGNLWVMDRGTFQLMLRERDDDNRYFVNCSGNRPTLLGHQIAFAKDQCLLKVVL